MKRFFKPVKRLISFEEYMQDTLITAKRIVEVSRGKQRYSSAQFEMSLIAFGDLETLQQEMDDDIEVQFPKQLVFDWESGFDWLDLAVKNGDEDAIKYFKNKMQEKGFAAYYRIYKEKYRPDCALQDHEEKIKLKNFNSNFP
ncbi:Uncharacterised protein [Legionella steigerwaltii]|uniref:Uncharacterized protein n=1 Tax=Legionella steigerwaltii TaxID=460 RepID=A0A378L8A2_9GAMM|nr:hypothetical protein [Legionella steigerwaltii]KTD77743.1 hypothetical protein Lstg_2100 [Legionella steigerwaltii]STY23053.1 Uncharacterised protein [Legionella steigerwaltii]